MTTTTGSSSRHRLDALYHLAVELSAQRRLEAVLDVALRQCLELTESEFGFIGLVSGSDIDIVAIHGFHPAPQFVERHHTIPLRPNVFSQVVIDDRPVRTVDARQDPNRVGQPGGHPPVEAFMGVPLRVDGRPIGMIGLANRPDPYDEDHERLLLTYAGLIAMHVQNAQLYEALETSNDSLERLVAARTRALADARDALAEKAARLSAVLSDMARTGEQERLRIASDLHDSVNQLLIAAMLEVTSAQRRAGMDRHEEAALSLESARTILSQVESEIRRVIHDLHPPVLDALGLTAAVRELVGRFSVLSEPGCELHIEGSPRRMAAKVELGIYRMLQEALHNACSHADASRIDVSLTFGDGFVMAAVADDGAGFDPSAMEPLSQTGFGLESMRRRIEDLHGRFALSTRPGLGTHVLGWIPEP